MSIDSLRTGDILLFCEHPNNCFMATIDTIIRCFTNSKYSHVGLVVVNPPWIVKRPGDPGIYVWDSSYHNVPDPADQKIKFGVALVPIRHYIDTKHGNQQLYIRKPVNPKIYDRFDDTFLTKLHKTVYGTHYDLAISHWLAGFLHLLIQRTTTTFFCSAFVSYALSQAGILDAQTDWTIISPAELSSDNDMSMDWVEPYTKDVIWSNNASENRKDSDKFKNSAKISESFSGRVNGR